MLTVDLALRRVDDRSPSPTPHSLAAHHHHPRARARLPTSLLTVNVPAPAPASFIQSAPRPRWRTAEFRFYYVVFALVVPAMVRVACRATSPTTRQYAKYGPRLSDGWLFGWRVDVTDPQYRLFRSHLGLLVLLALVHLSLSHLSRALLPRPSTHAPSSLSPSPSPSPSRIRASRARFSAAFSLVLLLALHGSSLLKILVVLALNYRIALLASPPSPSHSLPGRARARGRAPRGWWRREWTPYATWGFNVAVLFANELCEGYRFAALHPSLAWLDEYGGLLPRWHVSWNISMLRLVSFNMEYFWACSAAAASAADNDEGAAGGDGDDAEGGLLRETLIRPSDKPAPRPARVPSPSPSPSHRAPAPSPSPTAHNYSPALYLAYVLYPPLYLAGPVMTYPSFWAQLAPPPPPSSSPSPASSGPAPVEDEEDTAPDTSDVVPPRAHTYRSADELHPRALAAYAARFIACLVAMELVLHALPVVALKDSGKGWWRGMTAAEVAMVGFWNLIVVWLKLLLPWRLFRLWALLDGVVPPENMVRCMANNYSTLGFWRSWHRSFNMWGIRYIYIPLGGASRPVLSMLGVFTFVALWHDLRLRLLVWGWGVVLFVLPEMAARRVVPYNKFGSRPWYRHLAALGGVFNVLLMMTANLVGFVVGVDGATALWSVMLGDWAGRGFLLFASACLFVGVQLMFEYREEERRRGISRKC